MRVTRLLSLLLLISFGLCGCQSPGEIENQAYVLILGIERLEDGQLGLTAKIPKIGKGDPSEEKGGSGGSPYLTFSVSGASWPQAHAALQRATPRQVNLSHMELLVISAGLAAEDDFPEILRGVAETRNLYTTARFAICDGSARRFVESGETVIGTRMSADLRATLKHYADQGYIPDSSLADIYFATNSFYSDPVAIWASMEVDETSANDAESASRVLSTPMKQRYSGAALFREGVFLRALTLEQTRILNLIKGGERAFPFSLGEEVYELKPERKTALDVEIDGRGKPMLRLSLLLSTLEALPPETLSALEASLATEIRSLFDMCRRERCDPFGFAEQAASRFPTNSDWLSYGWRNRYAEAALTVDVMVRCARKN